MHSSFEKDHRNQDGGQPTEERQVKKWRLTFGREKYPTLPLIVGRPIAPGSKTETANGDSQPQS